MQKIITEIAARVKSFPNMPGVATKLLVMLDDPDVSASQIEEIVRLDPGITANILKLTNSAYFGFASRISSIEQAVILLGAKRIIQLVIATCVNTVMDKTVSGYDLPEGELWRHSIAVSVTAESLAKKLKVDASSEVFTAALLHDVGKLVLGGFVKKDITKIEDEASRGIPFHEAEQKVLGTDHAEVGAQILQNWSFPPQIVKAVRLHHSPDSGEDSDTLTDIVHVADMLCLMIGIGVGREGLHYKSSPLAAKRLGVAQDTLEIIAINTQQWIAELSEVFK